MPEAKAKKGGGSVGSFPDFNPCSGCACGPLIVIVLAILSIALFA